MSDLNSLVMHTSLHMATHSNITILFVTFIFVDSAVLDVFCLAAMLGFGWDNIDIPTLLLSIENKQNSNAME